MCNKRKLYYRSLFIYIFILIGFFTKYRNRQSIGVQLETKTTAFPSWRVKTYSRSWPRYYFEENRYENIDFQLFYFKYIKFRLTIDTAIQVIISRSIWDSTTFHKYSISISFRSLCSYCNCDPHWLQFIHIFVLVVHMCVISMRYIIFFYTHLILIFFFTT